MYVCMYVYTLLHTYFYIHTLLHTYIYIHFYIHTHTHAYIHIHTYSQVSVDGTTFIPCGPLQYFPPFDVTEIKPNKTGKGGTPTPVTVAGNGFMDTGAIWCVRACVCVCMCVQLSEREREYVYGACVHVCVCMCVSVLYVCE